MTLGVLPDLPTAFLEGRDVDLLTPLRIVAPGEAPSGAPPVVERQQVAEALAIANDSYGHSGAHRLASRLADPTTHVVISGQQPGLGGGPLYTLSKALATVRWAEELERRGQSAVPVFWVATEDHDFAEVARMAVPGREGLERFDLGDDPAPLMPVGMRTLGNAVVGVLEAWRATTTSESYLAWLDRVAAWYRPDARFGEAFCRIMVGMLGDRSPLLVDAMLPAVKRAQRPCLTGLIDRREDVDAALESAERAIVGRGYQLQVRPQRGASPLFLFHDGARRRIEWRGPDRFGLRGLEGFDESVELLRETARDNPAVLSPGVLARPVLQDAVFGTYLQVLGPGEVSYFPQVAPVYERLGVEAPWITPRPQMLVLPRRQAGRMSDLGLELDRLVAGTVDGDALIAARAGDDVVGPVLSRIEAELAGLRQPVLDLDRSLEKPLEKTAAQVRRGLEMFAAKVAAASARRHQVERNRVSALLEAVRPSGTLQERIVAGAHFVGRHDDFVERVLQQLGIDPRRLHVIDPEGP